VDSFVVVAEGAVTGRQVEINTEPDADVIFNFTFAAPAPTVSTSATFSGFAVDAQGNVSSVATLSVAIPDGTAPVVSQSLSANAVAQGETLEVQVSASDAAGLDEIGMRIYGPGGGQVVTRSAPVTGNTAARTFTWDVPAAPEFGTYEVESWALDVSGNTGTSGRASLVVAFVDAELPMLTLFEPDSTASVPPNAPLFVRVGASDNDALTRVDLRTEIRRGDPDLGTEETVVPFAPWTIDLSGALPADTVLTRFMAPGTGEAQGQPGETLRLILEARDRQGNVGRRTVLLVVADPAAPGGS
jgi:hypothetical protein